mmetsp:Transcript_34868/g.90509  ORF Transcript_34868/g.90509 Transcript_34868/m.90509 type:complete len:304 (-) Transcript_34868:75-986(-)
MKMCFQTSAFNMLHPDFLLQLPEYVQQDLYNRVHVIPNGGVLSRELVNLVQRQAATTGNFHDMEALLTELAALDFEDARLLYLKYCDSQAQVPTSDSSQLGFAQAEALKFPSFEHFNTQHGYGTWVPSALSLKRSFEVSEPEMLKEAARNIGTVTGQWLCGDMTFAMMKCVRGAENAKIFNVCQDFMNKFGEIWGIWFLHDKNLGKLREQLQLAAKRYERLQSDETLKYLYVDDLTGDSAAAQTAYWKAGCLAPQALYRPYVYAPSTAQATLEPTSGLVLHGVSSARAYAEAYVMEQGKHDAT